MSQHSCQTSINTRNRLAHQTLQFQSHFHFPPILENYVDYSLSMKKTVSAGPMTKAKCKCKCKCGAPCRVSEQGAGRWGPVGLNQVLVKNTTNAWHVWPQAVVCTSLDFFQIQTGTADSRQGRSPRLAQVSCVPCFDSPVCGRLCSDSFLSSSQLLEFLLDQRLVGFSSDTGHYSSGSAESSGLSRMNSPSSPERILIARSTSETKITPSPLEPVRAVESKTSTT